MKKTGLILAVLVVAIAAVVQPASAGPWTDFVFSEGPYRDYSPTVDLRDAHRAYWDEGLVDEIGKVITLPFTLPMRVKSEWERLNTKATHWKKARESYEKGFPSQKEP